MGKQSTDGIALPECDSRLYKGLTLENGLEVLLVSDPETDKVLYTPRRPQAALGGPGDSHPDATEESISFRPVLGGMLDLQLGRCEESAQFANSAENLEQRLPDLDDVPCSVPRLWMLGRSASCML